VTPFYTASVFCCCGYLQAKNPQDPTQGCYTAAELRAGLFPSPDEIADSIRRQAAGASFDDVDYNYLRVLVDAWDRWGFGLNAALEE